MATVLWTDLIDPAELTGYVREALSDIEARRPSLARFLPHREVQDIQVRFRAGQNGLVPIAKFRAYDAELEVGSKPGGRRLTLELPGLGQAIPITEYDELRARGGNVSDAQIVSLAHGVARQIAQSIVDTLEHQRGIVLTTGGATIDQDNFQSVDDFGRSDEFTRVVDPGEGWDVAGTDRIGQLTDANDLYSDTNGDDAGVLLMNRETFRKLRSGSQFQTQLLNGGARNPLDSEVVNYVQGAGLPKIEVYNRKVSVDGVTTKVIPDNVVLLLPEPVAPDDWQSADLGSTFIGRTLSSLTPEYGLADVDQPGVVAGVYRSTKTPHSLTVEGDAIGLPVLANANRSMALTVV